MMKGFIALCNIYFTFEIVMHGILPFVELLVGSILDETITTLVHQSMEFLITIALLGILRPRDWPEYFTLNMLDQSFSHEENEQPKLPQINEAKVKRGLSSSSFSSLS